jgi:hypothetical protein
MPEPEVLSDREAVEDAAALWHVRDALPGPCVGRHARQVRAVEAHPAAHRPQHAGDRQQRRGLARTVRAEQGDHLAGADGEVDLAQHGGAAVPGGQAIEFKNRVGHHAAPASAPMS